MRGGTADRREAAGLTPWVTLLLVAAAAAVFAIPGAEAAVDLSDRVKEVTILGTHWADSNVPVLGAFGLLIVVLLAVGVRRAK